LFGKTLENKTAAAEQCHNTFCTLYIFILKARVFDLTNTLKQNCSHGTMS
jgi:hypothetical protein